VGHGVKGIQAAVEGAVRLISNGQSRIGGSKMRAGGIKVRLQSDCIDRRSLTREPSVRASHISV